MEETKNTINDAIKERLTNPFLGKFILSWFIWNWKIPYATFFVSEENLESKNKLDFIVSHLKIDSLSDFLIIHGVPILITIALIWGVPYISHEAYKASEKFRKKKSLKKKETDDYISNFKDQSIRDLSNQIEYLKKRYRDSESTNAELFLLLEYFGNEYESFEDSNRDTQKAMFWEQFEKDITDRKIKDKVYALIKRFKQKSNEHKPFEFFEQSEKDFLLRNGIVKEEKGEIKLSSFGKYISKSILFKKYNYALIKFNGYIDL